MDRAETAAPKATELFFASLVATALVYVVGVTVIAVLIGLTSPSGGISDALGFLAFFATVGVFAAMLAQRRELCLCRRQYGRIGNFFMGLKIAFTASRAAVAQTARAALIARYGDSPLDEADVIVALGGDGFMLQTLHGTQHLPAAVYGMKS